MIIFYNDKILADQVRAADNFIKRFFGLMGSRYLSDGDGLLLLNCPSVHCFFMKVTIDAVYLSKDMKVLGIETLKPWRIGKRVRKTVHVLELKEGKACGIELGDQIKMSGMERKGGMAL